MATTAPPLRAAPDPGDYGSPAHSEWLDINWRSHQRWIELDGRSANVIEFGEGSPIVFIHGLSGAWTNWLENLPHLAREHRVVAMDLPGFGASPMPAEKISISGYARAVEQILDKLEIDAACIVGNSMGGFTGAELAIAFPQRVERLVLVSAAGLTIEHQRNDAGLALLRYAEAQVASGSAQVAKRSERFACRARLRKLMLYVVAAHPDQFSPELAMELFRCSGKPGFVDALDALTSYPIRDRLPEIACPTLVVWGEKDKLVPVRDAYEFERLIPDSRAVVYPDTGHVSMLERPAAFNALLGDFLSE